MRRQAVEPDDDWVPRYNISPTQNVPVIRQHLAEPKRLGSRMRWGLIPFWAKDPSIGYKMINARAETVATKPAFRDAIKKRRCLIPADGFYEWSKIGKTKTPFCCTMADGSLFAFAGFVGFVALAGRQGHRDLLDHHHDPQCPVPRCSRPHARHPAA